MENIPPQPQSGGGGMIVLMIVLFCCVMTTVGGAAWYYGYIPGTGRNIIRKSKIQEIDNDVGKIKHLDPSGANQKMTIEYMKSLAKICKKVRANRVNISKLRELDNPFDDRNGVPLWFTLRHARATGGTIDACLKDTFPLPADIVNFESYVGTIDNMNADFENVDAESSTCRQFKEYSTDENTPWFSRVDHGLEFGTLVALAKKCNPSSNDDN